MILIIGSQGSIGRRYKAILRYMGAGVSGYDPLVDPPYSGQHRASDGVIVASPTSTHLDWLIDLSDYQGPVLIEKPAGWIDETHRELIQAKAGPRHVVSNWLYLSDIRRSTQSNIIFYNYWDPGREDYQSNFYQPLVLGNRPRLLIDSPVFFLTINNRRITLEHIQRSYIDMISDWLMGRYDKLWTLHDAVQNTQLIRGLPCNHGQSDPTM